MKPLSFIRKTNITAGAGTLHEKLIESRAAYRSKIRECAGLLSAKTRFLDTVDRDLHIIRNEVEAIKLR